jgi:hypothetical protein
VFDILLQNGYSMMQQEQQKKAERDKLVAQRKSEIMKSRSVATKSGFKSFSQKSSKR